MAVTRRSIRKSLRTNFDPDVHWYIQRLKLRAQQASHIPGLLRGGELDRPIFIIGAPRSGTMLLYSVLRSSPHLAHWRPSEAHEVWEADYHPARRGWDSNVLRRSDLSPEAARRIRRSFYLVAGNQLRLIDKTPRNVLRIDFVDAVFPNGLFVFLKRDGRENVNSLINAWRSLRYRTYRLPEPHSIPGVDSSWWKFVLYPGWREDRNGPLEEVCAKQWLASNEHMLEAQRDLEPSRWIEVRYEDLVEDPVSEVEKIFGFAGVSFDEEVRSRAEGVKTTPINVVTPPERGKWKRENPREIEAVLPLLEPALEKLGYES
jgi:Sulfotransferase family